MPRATNSRGRTWRKAMRAVMRSTSLTPLSCARNAAHGPEPPPAPPAPRSAVVADKRRRASVRSRWGSSSQALSSRLPMPVMQVSSSENRVGASSPRRVLTSSRLRRVVAGRSIRSSPRCTCTLCTWVSARPWVCSAYCSSAAAAAWASPSPWAPQACRLAAPRCSSSFRSPRALSNCQSGRRLMGPVKAPPWRSACSCCSKRSVTPAL
ncbi:hypothetical protein D3C71_1298130 [compost metagenome]